VAKLRCRGVISENDLEESLEAVRVNDAGDKPIRNKVAYFHKCLDGQLDGVELNDLLKRVEMESE